MVIVINIYINPLKFGIKCSSSGDREIEVDAGWYPI